MMQTEFETLDGQLIRCYVQAEAVVVPEEVTVIGADAFSGCKSLKRILLSRNLNEVRQRAFLDCVALEEIELPAGVRKIGNHAFSRCRNLTKVTLPETLEQVGSGAFTWCPIKDIVFPQMITDVEATGIGTCGRAVCAPGVIFSEQSPQMKAALLRGFIAHTDLYDDEKKKQYMKYMIGQRKKLLLDAARVGETDILAAYEHLALALPPDLCNELIELALKEKKTDVSAWLMDYKNRTISLVKEEKSRRIKESHELDNPYMARLMKNTWKWEAQEDGTLKLIQYIGNEPEIVVPPVIGKNRVTMIDFQTFAECQNIQSITIPASITTIHSLASASGNAPRITVEEGNARYRVVNDCLLDKNILIMAYPGCTVPDCVSEIGWSAFSYCHQQTKIDIPDGVKKIGSAAFMGCVRLTEVSLPKKLAKLERNLFALCSSLESIVIPEAVKSIEEGAFQNCVALKKIVIPNCVTKIGKMAFGYCSNLIDISIPESVISIGADAFYGCSSLTDVMIPENVQKIGKKAFGNCTQLRIHGKEGSAAQKYAQSEGLVFIAE